jgi:hypothetical protein
MIGRLPEEELDLELVFCWALLDCSTNPKDKEPTTAVARKSRRETVIKTSYDYAACGNQVAHGQ